MYPSRFFLDACGFYDDFKYDPKTISLYDKISLREKNKNVKLIPTNKTQSQKIITNVAVVQRNNTLLDEKPATQINIELLHLTGTQEIADKMKKTKYIPMETGEIRFIVLDKLTEKFFMVKLYPLGYFEVKEIFDTIESFTNIVEEVRALLSKALGEKVTLLKYEYNRVVKLENHNYFKKLKIEDDYIIRANEA